MSPRASPAWSLRRRLTIWFTVATTLLGVAMGTTSILLLQLAANRELAALMTEEFAELEARLAGTQFPAGELAQIVRELSAEHPANELVWGAWSQRSGELLGAWGRAPLPVSTLPAAMPPGRMERVADDRRWRVQALGDDLLVGLSLGSEPQRAQLRRSMGFLLGFVAVATALSSLAGAMFGRRVARELRRIAAEARAVRSPEERVSGADGAPEEIREVSDALQAMLAHIQGEAERVRIVAAGMAHELRSPIQNLLGETEVTLLRERSGGEYRAALQSNLEDLRDLARAVDNLVTLCGTSPGERPRALERFDLGREADLRLARERAHAQRRGVSIELALDGDLALKGDREALLLALRNLVSNAIDWSPPGGVVRVALSGVGQVLELVVEDMGPGVPADEREAIFEPFRRGRSAAGRRAGYGLGLAIVRSAVQTHGGSVDVSASAHGGARFRVRIPRGEPLEPRRAEREELARPAGRV